MDDTHAKLSWWQVLLWGSVVAVLIAFIFF
jgi:hypothetical protein